jgi:hypothetical protein
MTVPWQCASPSTQLRQVVLMDSVVTPRPDKFGVPRCSAPAQLVQPLVIDAEVVGNLVDHRDGDLVDDLLL